MRGQPPPRLPVDSLLVLGPDNVRGLLDALGAQSHGSIQRNLKWLKD
jgi:hypothetical protein